jgi:hypothetical protein
MTKFGYRCACGWRIDRGRKTRRAYADLKRNHASGKDPNKDPMLQPAPCELMAKELRISASALVKGRARKS